MRKTILKSIGLLALLFYTLPAISEEEKIPAIPIQPSKFTMSETELKIWNDPAFQREFIESYKAETDIEPTLTSEEIEQMRDILALISDDKMEKAQQQILKELKKNEAASAVFDFTLANIYFQNEQYEDAATYYNKAVEKFPKFRRAWKNLSLIHIRENEFKEALPALLKTIELGENDSVTFGLLGFTYSSLENHLSAESAYRTAMMLDPDTVDWKMGLIRSFFKQTRYSEVIALTDLLIKDKPELSDLWLLQANAYIGLNKPLKAAEIFEIVDRLGKSTADSLYILGDIYINEELFDLAVNSYSRAIDIDDKGKADRVVRASKVLVAKGALDETATLIESIETKIGEKLETNEKKDLLKLKARIAVAEGSGEEEAKVLEEIVEIDPLDGEALILLGQHSQRGGDSEKAIFYYERAAAIPKHEADAKIRHAQLLVGQSKYKEALPLLRRAQFLKPRDNVQKYLEQVERISKTR